MVVCAKCANGFVRAHVQTVTLERMRAHPHVVGLSYMIIVATIEETNLYFFFIEIQNYVD